MLRAGMPIGDKCDNVQPAVRVKGASHSTASATDVTAVLSQYVTFCD